MAHDADALGHGLTVAVPTLQSTGAFVAETLTPEETFSIAYGGHVAAPVNHWHCNAAGDAGVGYDVELAEIGGLLPSGTTPPNSETCRGFAEFNIGGKFPATQALLKLDVYDVTDFTGVQVGGIYGQDVAYDGLVDIVIYEGNGTAELADFDASAEATIDDAFDTDVPVVEETFTVDITTEYNAMVNGSATSIGIRLQTATEPEADDTAITFDNLRIVLT